MRVLGLDLGTNSIGWAVVDEEAEQIIDTGVRIFPEGVQPKTIGMGDKEVSKNAARRGHRQTRRQFYRKRLRKIKLLEVLIEQEMCPLSEEELSKWKRWSVEDKSTGRQFPSSVAFMEWIRLNPYKLRARALTEKLTMMELGRVFYHLIQRRGFRSSRKGTDDPKILFEKGKPDENILSINESVAKMKGSTLGSYLNKVVPVDGAKYKPIVDDDTGKEIRVRGRYTTRNMYVEEFELVWDSQSRFLDLNERKVEKPKVRKYRGALTNKRNTKNLKYIRDKFGSENVKIEESKSGFGGKIMTLELMPLKKMLGGNIEWLVGEEGEKKIKFKSDESVLFWQRPLRSQKGLLGNCTFESEMPVIKKNGCIAIDGKGEVKTCSKKPCPISHPECELFRAYQFINNISYGTGIPLTEEQRNIVLGLIVSKDKSFDFKAIPKKLSLIYEKFNYEDTFKVSGCPTIRKLSSLFDKKVWDEKKNDIWQCFYFYEDSERLFEKIKKAFGFKKSLSDVEKFKLQEGYGNVSLKAIRNITSFLEAGYKYDRAVILGGVKNAFGGRWSLFESSHDEIVRDIIAILKEQNKDGEAIEKVKAYLCKPENKLGFSMDDPWFTHLYHHSQKIERKDELQSRLPLVENLRNPIVQQSLNEMRRLVNCLLDTYKGKYGANFVFDSVHVEMGRDLRNSKKRRQEMTFNNSVNRKKNEAARVRLAEYGLRPSRANMQKYLMYMEISDKAGQTQCPYTGKIINISSLLGRDNRIQVEHIIPYSVSLDDSFGNKTLCDAKFNGLKGNRTPYQFYQENRDKDLWGVDSWESVVRRAYRLLPYPKAKRFTAKKDFNGEDFISRQLNDSRYIAKKAAELLFEICEDVHVMPGQLTAELRHLWGLNNILHSIKSINCEKVNVASNSIDDYYVILDSENNVNSVHLKNNQRPSVPGDTLVVTGMVEKDKFKSKLLNLEQTRPDLAAGKYWAQVRVEETMTLIRKYIDMPQTDESQICFRGKVEKGKFVNESCGNMATDKQDGTYWSELNVLKKQFVKADSKVRPVAKRNQVLLFGAVKEGVFESYIYKCGCGENSGKYWLILTVDMAEAEFIKAVVEKPEVREGEFVLTTTVNKEGVLSTDIDPFFFRDGVSNEEGVYYAIIKLKDSEFELTKVAKDKPQLAAGEKLVEGCIWVDKNTNEVKLDLKKNREDHRHHAIDALVIALTKREYLQCLSTYNSQRKSADPRRVNSTDRFPLPWPCFFRDVQSVIDSILVSHRKSNKVLSKSRKGFSVRGQLHKENVFGERQAPQAHKAYHRRCKIMDLKNNKQISKVVDDAIRKLIERHLRDNCGVDTSAKKYDVPKDAFFKDGKPLLFLRNTKGGDPVPIKKVRIKEEFSNAKQLKSGLNQYVNPRNNHHALIYKDANGELKEVIVQFWNVVELSKAGEALYKLPEEGKEIVTVLEINDMFILGFTDEKFKECVKDNKQELLNEHLYRVQKTSSMYYTFRLHNASTILEEGAEWRIQSFPAWKTANPIKVLIDELGRIRRFE